MKILATVVGFCAVATFVLSYQMKSRRGILALNAGSRVLYVLQYILLGAFEGALLDVVAFLVSLVCAKSDSRFVKKHFHLTIILTNAAIIGFGLIVYQNVFSLLPIAGVLLHTGALWLDEETWIRRVSLLGSPFWFAYNVISHAYGACVGDILSAASIVTAMIRYDRRSVGMNNDASDQDR